MIRFTDICFISDDVMRLRRFYEDLFGVDGEGDEIHSSITIEGLSIAIDSSKLLKDNDAFGYVSGKSSNNIIISFNADDVDGEYERLKKKRIEMLNEPTTHPWGARSVQFKDPDGNIINFRTIL